MIPSKTYCFLIVVLAYKTKHIFGGRLTQVDQICSDKIKSHFLVKTEHPKAKTYCLYALSNFRLSETLENSSFLDAYAEQYYKWLLNFVTIGSKMKTPELYCRTIIGRKKSASFRSACVEELSSLIGNLNQSKKKIFQWMYYNITQNEIQASEALQGYIKHVSSHVLIDNTRHCPPKFCRDYYKY